MEFSRSVSMFAAVGGAALMILAGCASVPPAHLGGVEGESLLFAGEDPALLALPPVSGAPVRLRDAYLPGAATIVYEEGRDFRVDHARGALIRLPDSRLPDFRTNVLHGREEFDHTKFPGYGNKPFFAYADYTPAAGMPWPRQPSQAGRLRATHAKLAEGRPVTIVAFGDSITNGGEASAPELIFWNRWVADLRMKYPRAAITVVNGATGGDTTTRGLQRLQAKVIDARPDLVLVGFGMNDHNRRGVPLPDFERQLGEIVARIRAATEAEVILLSTFPPNPRWVHGSRRMEDYAAATARVAEVRECAYADVFGNWRSLTVRKRPEDLLANNINHPNDFGHWIYYRVLSGIGL